MPEPRDNLSRRIAEHLDRLFRDVGPSQALFDLKEELRVNLRERAVDYMKQGVDEQEAFQRAVGALGDLSGLVEDMRELGRDHAKQAVYMSI